MMKKFFTIIFIFFLFFYTQLFLQVRPASAQLPVAPARIQFLAEETEVQVQGIVVTEPGVLGQQIFFINGAQIYSYYKDFPDLKIGDKILVKGIISESRGEKRIKIKTNKDIKILEHNLIVPVQELKIKEINKNIVGRLIKIKGQVIEKTGLHIYVDDNTGEIDIYIKNYTNIDKSRVNERDEVEMTGILSKYNKEYRLLPREEQDILITRVYLPEKKETGYQMAGASAEIIDFKKIEPYCIIASVVLGGVFLFLFFKKGNSPH